MHPQALHPKCYPQMGIDTNWDAGMVASMGDAQVSFSDDFSALAWDLAITCAKNRTVRNLSFSGWPRRFTLMLHKDHRADTIKAFHDDCVAYDKIKDLDADWVGPIVWRSSMELTRVVQIRRCFESEGWKWSDRLHG